MNITIFIGPTEGFGKLIPQVEKYETFKNFIDKHDKELRTHIHKQDGVDAPSPDLNIKEYIENLVIFSEDYSTVQEHAIQSFVPLLDFAQISNLFLQNPPDSVKIQLERKFKNIKIQKYKYKSIDLTFLKKIDKKFDNCIIGQPKVKTKLLSSLYSLTKNCDKQIKTILFYGPSGVGKTETAKFLSRQLNEKLFREQMSMYQNGEFQSYLFGEKHNQDSFAKRLGNRKSNIILLDEFDKCNPVFHSAFYQLFDEGVFKDKNYKIELTNSIIICTSNYLNRAEIKQHLGEPIYSRFDSIIEFSPLSNNDKVKILNSEFNNYYKKLDKNEKKLLAKDNLINILLKEGLRINNIREMKTFISDLVDTSLVQTIFS
jgi:ATP-dependent Clp protease ATP-binding subunit ClpA